MTALKDHYTVAYPVLKKHHFIGTIFYHNRRGCAFPLPCEMDADPEVSANGMDIEAHTLTHPNLASVPHAQAVHEGTDSKGFLEEHLNKKIAVLAYPYGRYTEDVIAVTKQAGYEGAVSVCFNDGYLYRADQSFTLPRYAIEGGESLDYSGACQRLLTGSNV